MDPQVIGVGTVLDEKYRLLRAVSEGGMGTVFEALQLRIKKRVAVKIMSRELTRDPAALARFRREADITSALGHPHIVSVVDYGLAASGEPYLVMEYLDGEDLESRLQKVGRLELSQAFRVVRQVASALAAAHAKGIVHRDLKPGNIFLVNVSGEDDFVKVVDFGISKVQADLTKLTQAHMVMGTPHYMSPEQATGRSDLVDARTDQWALACITWEMLSGRCPFESTTPTGVLHLVMTSDPPSLLPLVPGLGAEVETVLRRGMAKNPNDRFASVRKFARALRDAALIGLPSELTPTPQPISVDTEETPAPFAPWSDKLASMDTVADSQPFGSLNATHADAAVPPKAGIRPWKRPLLVGSAAVALGLGGGAMLAKIRSRADSAGHKPAITAPIVKHSAQAPKSPVAAPEASEPPRLDAGELAIPKGLAPDELRKAPSLARPKRGTPTSSQPRNRDSRPAVGRQNPQLFKKL